MSSHWSSCFYKKLPNRLQNIFISSKDYLFAVCRWPSAELPMAFGKAADGLRQSYRWPSAELPMAFGKAKDDVRQTGNRHSADRKTMFDRDEVAYHYITLMPSILLKKLLNVSYR